MIIYFLIKIIIIDDSSSLHVFMLENWLFSMIFLRFLINTNVRYSSIVCSGNKLGKQMICSVRLSFWSIWISLMNCLTIGLFQ